jgi:hypothetical protein
MQQLRELDLIGHVVVTHIDELHQTLPLHLFIIRIRKMLIDLCDALLSQGLLEMLPQLPFGVRFRAEWSQIYLLRRESIETRLKYKKSMEMPCKNTV